MQSVRSRIWTRVAMSISYDDNYTTDTSTSGALVMPGYCQRILSPKIWAKYMVQYCTTACDNHRHIPSVIDQSVVCLVLYLDIWKVMLLSIHLHRAGYMLWIEDRHLSKGFTVWTVLGSVKQSAREEVKVILKEHLHLLWPHLSPVNNTSC